MVPLSMMGCGSGSEGISGTRVEVVSSRGCEGGIAVEFLSEFLMSSATILVTAEKAGGD